MSRILRFFVCLGTLFFVGNAFAAGYSCPEYKKYTCCAAGYYMTKTATSTDYYGTPVVANACRPCSVYGENYTCPAGSDGCTGAPQAITIDVKCQPGEYLPQGKTSCETCTAGNYCEGVTVKGVSLVTGAEKDFGLSSCSSNTGMLYSNSAAGSSSINDCYLTLADDESVETVNRGTSYCQAGYYCGNGGRRIYYDADNEERDLTDSRPTIAPSTACARGSYSDDMATSCEVCPNGTTTSGTGSDYCDVTCSNSANVATWVTPEWTPNYVSNSCKVASCVACTKGTGVASCTASTDGNKCTYTATCSSGYKNPTCNGTSCSCTLDSVTCAAGQYLPKGATSCATCPAGYKCPSSSKTYTVSTTTDQGNTACSGSTEYQDTTGQTSCKTPSDGYYKKDNTSQQPCGTGYFCKSGVRTACTTYGTGYTTDTTTASVNTQCYLNVAGGKVRNGTTGTTLNTCAAGKYKAAHKAYYGTSYSCDSCPTVESGWTMGTDTGLTNYTSCYETKAATSVSSYCSAGQLKKNATSATAWGTATISTAFQAKGGSIVNGQTCTLCSSGTYSAGGTATSCSSCDSAYPYSDAGASSASSCYKNGTKTGSQLNGSVPTNCYSVTSWNSCTPGTCTYRIYKSGTTTSCTPTNCTKTPAAVTAESGYRTNGASCTACPNGYPNSADGNSGGITACYSNSKSRAWTGSQVNGSVPTNCNSVTSWNSCSVAACSYVAYSNSSGNGDGTIKSGCSTNSANCTKTPAAVTAKSGYRTNGTSCTACPSGYPNSADGNSGGITACYSNSKSRAWTGSQVNGTVPTNCNSVSSWNACSLPACSYVAYSNSTGNGDGTIKSGCSTNNANCTKTVAAVTAKSGYYVSGTSCTACSGLASGMYPNSDNGNTGGMSACRTNSLSGQVIAKANASSATQCEAGTFKAAHTVNYGSTSSCSVCATSTYSDAGAAACTACATANGYTNSGTTAASHAGVASCKTTCSGTQYVATAGTACVTVGTGYYGRTAASTSVAQNATLARTKCPSIYVNGAAATQESECAVQTTAGKYIAAAKDTEQTKCPAKNYCPSASVKYGATNSPTACPTADSTTARTTYPTDYLNPTLLSINNQGWSTGLGAITSCSANYSFKNDAGNFSVESVGYNATTGKYDVGGGKYYTLVNKGWYLVDKYSDTYCNTSTNRMLYHNVAECPANSYCPGYSSMPLCSTGTHNDEMGKYACSSLGNGYNSSPAKSGAATACYLTTTAGKFVAAAKAAESTCTAGGWCAGGTKVNYESTGGRTLCSSLTGVSVSGGTYTSAAGASANTACKYTAPNKTITGCKTVTTNTVTYSGTAWPATTYGVTANGGYIISGNNTAAATCSQCGTAKYSAGGTATSCSACPTADSGWTAMSPAGSTAYTACYEYQTPANCASGSVKRAASSATAYSSTISLLSTLKSKAGYYASTTATSCTICPAGSSCAASATAPTTCANWTYAASTGMSSCTACPALTSGWAKADSTGTGWKSHTSCVQTSPTPTNCAGGNLKQVAASNGATTWGASAVNSALSSNAGYYVNGTACSACTGATYYGGGTATSCTACPSIYTSNTDAAKSKIEQCQVKTTGGYYIKTAKDEKQTQCEANHYCPSATVAYGDTNSQNACPTAADHKRATIPAEYYASSIAGTSLSTSAGRAAVTQCQVLNTYNGTRGSLYDYLTYNATTQKYDVQGSVLWFKANPGYYLTTATGCGTYAYYGKAVECDKNAYCPGKDKVECNSSNQATVQVEKFGLELCSALGNGKYATSDGGAAANSTAACYLTTTGQNFVAAAGAAESACTAGGWCPGNVKVAYGSTGGRNTCPTTYPSSAASSNSNLDCYVTTAAGKYVATVGAGQVNCAGTGYYCPGGTNVYSGAYGSRLTTGGRTQCPAGYRDLVATVSTTKEAQCTMNVAGGKFVKVAKESTASGTCDAGYAKAAHSVTYGNTSACAACTGATYAASTGQASCTACPTAKTYASAVKSYGYWNNGKDGDHTISGGCYVTMSGTLSNGSLTWHGCYLGTDGDYGNGGGKRCYVHQDNLKCNAGYYASTLSNGYVWNNTRAGLLGDTCVGVGAGYYSAADVLTRSQCPTGLTTIGYGAGADEVTDCGRILHFGDDKLYLRSGKKTTPSLNVKIGDTTYYGNMTAGTGKGKLRLKSGSTTYSVHDDSM